MDIVTKWAQGTLDLSSVKTTTQQAETVSDDSDDELMQENEDGDLLLNLAKKDKTIFVLREKNRYNSGIIEKCNERLGELEKESERMKTVMEARNEESGMGL